MADTFSFRPKHHSVDELKKIARKHHVNLNRYIEEAVNQKIADEALAAHQGPTEALARKITQVVVEHLDLKLLKPGKSTREKINKKFEGTTRKGDWISDEDARPGR